MGTRYLLLKTWAIEVFITHYFLTHNYRINLSFARSLAHKYTMFCDTVCAPSLWLVIVYSTLFVSVLIGAADAFETDRKV